MTDPLPLRGTTGSDPTDRALAVIRDQLVELDTRDVAAGRPTLADQDLHWRERKSMVIAAALSLPDVRPAAEQVAQVGALTVAFLVALEAAEVVDPSSGEDVAA